MTSGSTGPVRVALFGATGLLGRELRHSLAKVGEVIAPSRQLVDLRRRGDISRFLEEVRPRVLVNAAGFTNVDGAELNVSDAMSINCDAVREMATAARRWDTLLIHYSTDYVFDGTGRRPWQEGDAPAPINAYGTSKLMGEQAILQSGCRSITLRVSWLYGRSGRSFFRTILSLATTRSELRIVKDQVGAPTHAGLVAEITSTIIPEVLEDEGKLGLYHLAAAGETSWFEYGSLAIEEARKAGLRVVAERIIPVSGQSAGGATRPLNSRLNTSKISSTFRIRLPDWKSDVVRLAADVASGKINWQD